MHTQGKSSRGAYIGMDVHKNICSYAILTAELQHYKAGWISNPSEIRGVVRNVVKELGSVAVGIDAPRCALTEARPHYWGKGHWRQRHASERGYGRHCEVVVAALRLANPQYTPLWEACPKWMKLGFELFKALDGEAEVYEVFPRASLNQLDQDDSATFSISLKEFARGPEHMLDAYVAAYTVHEYLAGRGAEIGGGDGLGSIILPRSLPQNASEVLKWPKS